MSLLEMFPGQGGSPPKSATPEQDLLRETLQNDAKLRELNKDFAPRFLFGNSYGLYAALVVAGVISAGVALHLARKRAELVEHAESERENQGLSRTGMLSVIGKDVNFALSLADRHGLHISNFNGPSLHVLSGPKDRLEKVMEELGERAAKMLHVEGAYHDPLRAEESRRYRSIIRQFGLRNPRPDVTLISSTDPRVLKTARDVAEELEIQMVRPVELEKAAALAESLGAETFVDTGPTNVLQKIFQKLVPRGRVLSLESDIEQIKNLRMG